MNRIARISILLAGAFAFDKVLGILRQIILARQFGLSAELDAFNTANNLPDLLFALIAGTSLSMAFIPLLSEQLQVNGRPAAWDLFSRFTNLIFLGTAAVSIILAIFARPLVQWQLGVAPGFSPPEQELVVTLMRLNLIATVLFSVTGLISGALQANQHFLLPAIVAAINDLGQIVGVLILAPKLGYHILGITLPAFGMGIYGLVYGSILGAILHLVIQIPGLIVYQFHWTPVIDLRHPGVLKVFQQLGPRFVQTFAIQLVFVARDNLASRLPLGSVTALTYGWLIMQVPQTLIGKAVATALMPTLAEMATRGELDSFRQTVNRALRVILALALPGAVLLIVVVRPLLSILNFNSNDANLVTWVTRAYLVGLVGHSLLEIAERSFYALQQPRLPMLASMLNAAFFITVAIISYQKLGPAGIALANALGFTIEPVFLLFFLARRFPGILRLERTPWRAALASGGGALAAYSAFSTLPLPPLLQAFTALALGGLVALPFIWPEIKLLAKL